MKGQASLDQLTSSGVLLLAIAAFLAFTFVFFSNSTGISDAKSAVGTISRAADYVDSSGYGTNITVQVRLPAGVLGFAPTGSTIRMELATQSGQASIFENTRAAVVGTLPNSAGIHRISVAALANGSVMVQENAN